MSSDRRVIPVPPHRFPLQTANKKPPRQRPLVPSHGHCPSSPKAVKRTVREENGARVRDNSSLDPSVVFFVANEITAHPPQNSKPPLRKTGFFSDALQPEFRD